MQATKSYLDSMLPPILHCFDDPDVRVRYYACESLYNITKVPVMESNRRALMKFASCLTLAGVGL